MADAPSLSRSRRLKRLREELGLNKKQIAKAADVEPLAVSMWEKEQGASVPRAETFIKLSTFAQKKGHIEDALWLLEQAGVHMRDLRALAPQIDKVFAKYQRAAAPGELLEVRAALEGQDALHFPASLVRNRPDVRYIRIDHGLMEPVFRSGDILLIDESLKDKDPWGLAGPWIAVTRGSLMKESKDLDEQLDRELGLKEGKQLASDQAAGALLVGSLRIEDFGGIADLAFETMASPSSKAWLAIIGVDTTRRIVSAAARAEGLGKEKGKLLRHLIPEHLLPELRFLAPGWKVLGRVIAWIRPGEAEAGSERKKS